MTSIERQPAEPPRQRLVFQFSLRTLLLLFLVLASSLAVFGAWGVVVFLLLGVLASYVRNVESMRSLVYRALTLTCLMYLIGLLLPANLDRGGRDPLKLCHFNLFRIARALDAYHEANGCFPPAYIADKSSKPILSWRVLLLPYLDHGDLFKRYDLSQPWDGPTNKQLSATPLTEYVCPGDTSAAGIAQTSYVAVLGSNAAWEGSKSRRRPSDFPEGSSNTIMLVEVANSGISWAEPRDLSLDSLNSVDDKSALLPSSNHTGRREEFFFTYDNGARICTTRADGEVDILRIAGLSIEELKKILQAGGCGQDMVGKLNPYGNPTEHLHWHNIAALAVWLIAVGTLLACSVRRRRASINTQTSTSQP